MKAIAKEAAYYNGYRISKGDKFNVKPGGKVPKWAIALDKDGKPVTPIEPKEEETQAPEPATLSELASAQVSKPPVKARSKNMLET
jgi:hypothetical protein